MARFVAGAIAALLLATGGLLWWQHRAMSERPAAQAEAAFAPAPPDALPGGDPDAAGAPPPDAPEARPEDREARRFGRYDRDRNGAISRIEMMSSRTRDFRKLDTDGDNLLSFEEWAVATSRRFQAADGNGDAQLSRAEFATTAPKRSAKPKCRC